MGNRWKSHLPVAAGFAAGLLAVGVAAAKSVEDEDRRKRNQSKRKNLSTREVNALIALGFAAVVVAAVLVETVGGMSLLLPFVVWFLVFSVLRNRSNGTHPTILMRATKAELREAERKRAALALERERIEEFGEEGVRLIARASGAVQRILATEAAREGWLGQSSDLDFSGDQIMITESLKRVTALRIVIAESVAMPDRTADDNRLIKDAENAQSDLQAAVRQRVRKLLACAHGAEEVDQVLRREREELLIADRRDDLRSRLAALVHRTEIASTNRDLDSADAVSARVAGFHELRCGLGVQLSNVEDVSRVVEVESIAPPTASRIDSDTKRRMRGVTKSFQGNALTGRGNFHYLKRPFK